MVVSLTVVLMAITVSPGAQAPKAPPVTQQMLVNPNPDDWLMYSRT
jgi:hypothetical protein